MVPYNLLTQNQINISIQESIPQNFRICCHDSLQNSAFVEENDMFGPESFCRNTSMIQRNISINQKKKIHLENPQQPKNPESPFPYQHPKKILYVDTIVIIFYL